MENEYEIKPVLSPHPIEASIFIFRVVTGKKEATFGNGTMITFTANNKNSVIDFHNLALKLGAIDKRPVLKKTLILKLED